MSYNLYKSDGTLLTTIENGLTDSNSSSLTFIGKNVSNYGQSQNTNFLHLLENFNSDIEPQSPLKGQLWFNKSNQKIYVYTDAGFTVVGPGGASETSVYANNLIGGSAGSLPYQSANSTTSFLPIGPSDTVLRSNGVSISWAAASTLEVFSAVNATNSTYAVSANSALTAAEATVAMIAVTANNATTASVAVTQVISNKSNSIATTQFVHNVIPTGVILMWSGSIANIPTGWALCNGDYGTPDLRDRFIAGAGFSYPVGAIGGSTTTNAIVLSAGNHSHSGSTVPHTLTVDQIPPHSHTLTPNALFYPATPPEIEQNQRGDPDGPFSGRVYQTGITGGGQAHSHGIVIDGAHTHAINPIENRPPYYALCYIMKIV